MIPAGVVPQWSPTSTSTTAEIVLDGPANDRAEEPTTLWLHAFADGDGFRWSAYYQVDGEEAPFNEGEIQWGSSSDMETAKNDAWGRAIEFLRDLDYEDREIIEAAAVVHGGES